MRMEDFSVAEQHLRQALQLEPNNTDYKYSLGIDLYFEKKFGEAEPLLTAAAEVQKNDATTQADAYNVLIDQKKEKEAAPYLSATMKLMPGRATYRWEGNFFTRVSFRLDPADGVSQNIVGSLLCNKRRFNEAVIFLKAAVKADPKNDDYANDLMKCTEALKQ